MILVTHAYSRGNHGDGLLVDETLSVIREALPQTPPIVIGACDAASFADLPDVRQLPGITGAGREIAAGGVLFHMLRGMMDGRVIYPTYDDIKSKIKLVVAVGGGYLRSKTPIQTAKLTISHLAQLQWTAASGIPSIYLPQSIGPFCGPVRGFVRSHLGKLNYVNVRDDRTYAELKDLGNVYRQTDLALPELFEHFQPGWAERPARKTYLVARDLSLPQKAKEDYYQRLVELRRLLPEAEPLVQSSVRGNNDVNFYRRLGWADANRHVKDVTAHGESGVVVSVRLHGSLQSLIAGFPSVHLSYERKGFSAYSDLNIAEYVHSATRFDPALVARQVHAIRSEPAGFWNKVAKGKDKSIATKDELVRQIRSLYAA